MQGVTYSVFIVIAFGAIKVSKSGFEGGADRDLEGSSVRY